MLKVDHFAFEVWDMDRAISFYTGVLGLELISRETIGEVGEECVFLRLENCSLELLSKLSGKKDHPGPVNVPDSESLNCPHLCFSTDEMDSVLNNLKSNGVDLVKPMQEISGHARWIYFPDPDGNVLEFIQWL